MKYPIYLASFLWLILSVPLPAAAGSTGTRLPERPEMTPKDRATLRYDAGKKHSDRAIVLEHKVSGVSDVKKRATLQKKLASEYRITIKEFEKAIKYFPRYYEVHASLGHVLHKVGRIDESLAAYDESLRINPSYGKAVANRAEAYLDLNRLDDAKEAYLSLSESEQALANQLRAAMRQWVAKERDNPQGVDRAVVDQFADWLDQHNEIHSASQ